MFRPKVNKGVKYDTKKMYEQELCKSIANCGQTNKYLKEDGMPLCGWCLMGRKEMVMVKEWSLEEAGGIDQTNQIR